MMTASDAIVWATGSAEWLVPALLIIAVLAVAAMGTIPKPIAWAGFAGALAIIGVVISARFNARPQVAVQLIGWSCALVSLICAVVSAVARSNAVAGARANRAESPPTSVLQFGVLVLGVIAGVVQVVVLVMRLLYVVADLINVFPSPFQADFGFGVDGLWGIGFLFSACLISCWSTGSRALFICLLWIAVLGVTWCCALPAMFHVSSRYGLQATGAALLWLVAISAICVIAVIAARLLDLRRCDTAQGCDTGRRDAPPPWPGLHATCGILTVMVIMLVSYHLAVPVGVVSLAHWATFFVVAVAAALAASADFVLVSRAWSTALADAGIGLVSLAIASIAVMFVPTEPRSMADRYPMVFSALVVGLSAATFLWAYLAGVWMVRRSKGEASTAVRLIPHAKRAAFLNAVAGLGVATLLALWPRLPSIAVTDDTLSSMATGVSAELVLLLVVGWCARHLRRLTFHILTLLVLLSIAGFVAVRVLPFASRIE